jgi:hypothetical protein
MAVNPDVNTFIDANVAKPIVLRLRSDQAAQATAKVSLKIGGAAQTFKIGPTPLAATSGPALQHDVSVPAVFGTKVFLFDWGGGNKGDAVEVTAESSGAALTDTGVLL